MTTFCLKHHSLDPYFNLAAEEYLLKNYKEDFFIIWQSERSIVVGKHQNALAEINHRFVNDHHIHVARRLSGGGTVFHDPGNVNFTFIRSVKEISEVNFHLFTAPVINALKKLGVEAYTTGRNDLMVDGRKISGNAEHVYKKRVLHHGTLLFNSDLSKLKGALNVDLSRFEDRAVQSNRSKVTNIADYLKDKISVEAFADYIFKEVQTIFADRTSFAFSEADVLLINALKTEKYATWDWNYGYSPRYVFRNEMKGPHGRVQVKMTVIKGIIEELEAVGIDEEIGREIIGKRHRLADFKDMAAFSWLQQLLF